MKNSARIAPHTRYVIANTGRNGYFGTEETMWWLARAFDALEAGHPGGAKPQIRDISIQAGGTPSGSWPHASHRSGRDVDITYPRANCDATTGCPLTDMPPSTLDADATWLLMETWLVSGAARRIFVDSSLHAVLKTAARARGHSATKIASWFGPVIMHVANHANHFHVRFQCPADDAACVP
jgi:murein endopeptidase